MQMVKGVSEEVEKKLVKDEGGKWRAQRMNDEDEIRGKAKWGVT